MTRYRFLVAVGLLIFAVGAAGLFGILFALMNGQDYHPLAVIAVLIHFVFMPFLDRAIDRAKPPETVGEHR